MKSFVVPNNIIQQVITADKVLNDIDDNPNDQELVLINKNVGSKVIQHVDNIHSAYGKKADWVKRLEVLRGQGIPTNLKELSVNGNDLAEVGLKGSAIGETLNKLLMLAVDHKTNDKEKLLSLV